jgi:hypothetical protein
MGGSRHNVRVGLSATLAALRPAAAGGHGYETMAPMTSRRRWLAAAAALLAVAVSGCGSASPEAPPTGVDGLVIPTPDPQPEDFVETVDNPWFPLAAGARWEYDADPAAPGPPLTLVAEPGPEVAGVPTTTLVRTSADGVVRDHYAQDRDGNVWWFGREGEWVAGTSGAQAGLAMPADPRFGDGFRLARAPGLVAHARVVEVDRVADVPLGSYRPVVVLEVTEGSTTRLDHYARGTGLVRTGEAELVGAY